MTKKGQRKGRRRVYMLFLYLRESHGTALTACPSTCVLPWAIPQVVILYKIQIFAIISTRIPSENVFHSHCYQTPKIRFVRPSVGDIDTCIHAPNIHACFKIKVQDHRYVHHTHMHHSQGSRNIDKCIIHSCIRIKDHG